MPAWMVDQRDEAIRSKGRSASMMVGTCVDPEGTSGMIDASATLSRSVPWTRPDVSITAHHPATPVTRRCAGMCLPRRARL
jgi:hypothetical protein